LKKLESDVLKHSAPYENTGDILTRQARLNGAWGHYDDESERMEGVPPEVHVFVSGEKSPTHTWETECWCIPTVEFATEFVTVYRHRRMN
jgi:hypothetical protein